MEHLHLNLDNVHCKDCEVTKVDATFNKFFKTIRLDDKWSEEVDIPFNNENTVFTHIKGGKVDLYYKPKVELSRVNSTKFNQEDHEALIENRI